MEWTKTYASFNPNSDLPLLIMSSGKIPKVYDRAQGGAMRQFFSCPDTFSLIYMTSKRRGEVQEASPENEGVNVCGTHRCVKLLHTRIHMGSHWFHKRLLPPYSLWTQCEPKCELKWIRVCNKERLFFRLMAVPILSLSTWIGPSWH